MRQGISAANYQRSRSRTRPRSNDKAEVSRGARLTKERIDRRSAALESVNRKAKHYESSETSDERPVRVAHTSPIRAAQANHHHHQQQQQQQLQLQQQRRQQRLEALDRAAAEVAIRTVVSQMDSCFLAWRDVAHASWFRRMWLQFKAMKALHEFTQRSKIYALIRKRELDKMREAMRQWHRIANNNRKQQEDIYSADTVRYIYLASCGLHALQAYPRRRDAILAKLQHRDPLVWMIHNAQACGMVSLTRHMHHRAEQRELCRMSIRHYYAGFIRKWRASITAYPDSRLHYRSAARAANARAYQKGFLSWLQYVCDRLNVADQEAQATHFLLSHRLKVLFDRYQAWVMRSMQYRANVDGAVDWFEEKQIRKALHRWFAFNESRRPHTVSVGRQIHRLRTSPRQSRMQMRREAEAARHQWDNVILKKRYVFRWYVTVLQAISREDYTMRMKYSLHKWARWVRAQKLKKLRSSRMAAIGVRARDRGWFVTQPNPAHPYNDVIQHVQSMMDMNLKRRTFQTLVLEYLGSLVRNRSEWNSVAGRFYDWKAVCDANWFYKWYAKHKAVGNLLWNARRKSLCREQSHLGNTAYVHLALSHGFARFARNIQIHRRRRQWKEQQQLQQQQQQQRRPTRRDHQPVFSTPIAQEGSAKTNTLQSARRRFRDHLAASAHSTPRLASVEARVSGQSAEESALQQSSAGATPAVIRGPALRQAASSTPVQAREPPVEEMQQSHRGWQHLSMQQPEQTAGPAQVGTPRMFSWRNSSSTSSRSLQGKPPAPLTPSETPTDTASSKAQAPALQRPTSASSTGQSSRYETPQNGASSRDARWDVL